MRTMAEPAYDRERDTRVPAIYLPNASDPLAGLIDALTARRDAVIDSGLHRIRTEIPEYRAIVDPAFVDDVREHVALHHEALMRSVAAGQPLPREELGFMRARATRRVGRIPLAAFMQAFRIYQEEFWDALLAERRTARPSARARWTPPGRSSGTSTSRRPRQPRSTSSPSGCCTRRASACGATCSRTCSRGARRRRARSSRPRAPPGSCRRPRAS